MDALEDSRGFSTMVLAACYGQVATTEIDKYETSFTTKFGLYVLNVLSFGPTNRPATFPWKEFGKICNERKGRRA